ncbi:MAG: L-threonylcarbamoyladenylate synthase [Patescibacteria group bacterium]
MNSLVKKRTVNALKRALKNGRVVVMQTDTIYGIVGQALSLKTVERIYKLRRRSPGKPMVVLISSLDDLNLFGVKLAIKEEKILNNIWPGKVSVVLNCSVDIDYLHRGTNTIAFRLPRPRWLRNLLVQTGPLVAPSANLEGHEPARLISEAKKYFGKRALYLDGGKVISKPSTLVSLKKGKLKVLREGASKLSFKSTK